MKGKLHDSALPQWTTIHQPCTTHQGKYPLGVKSRTYTSMLQTVQSNGATGLERSMATRRIV